MGKTNNTTNALIKCGMVYYSGGQFITKLNRYLTSIYWSTRFGTTPGFYKFEPISINSGLL